MGVDTDVLGGVNGAGSAVLDKSVLDFMVIGTMKAGTTSLFHHLRHHPEIALPFSRQVHEGIPFFSHDTVYRRGWSAYMTKVVRDGFGEDTPPSLRWGSVIPQYMAGGVLQAGRRERQRGSYDERTVPSRMHALLPDVRLIAILRDPVERARSHHRMTATKGRERRSFGEAIDEQLRPDALAALRRDPDEGIGYVAWGEYGRILAGYRHVFPADQLLVLFTDDLEREPERVLARIYDFIGVSGEFIPENLGTKYNAGVLTSGFAWRSPGSWLTPSSPLSPQGLTRAMRRNAAARSLWHALPERGKRQVHRPVERLALRVATHNRRRPPNEVRANLPPSEHTLARLRGHYAQDAERLAELGLEPPWARS